MRDSGRILTLVVVVAIGLFLAFLGFRYKDKIKKQLMPKLSALKFNSASKLADTKKWREKFREFNRKNRSEKNTIKLPERTTFENTRESVRESPQVNLTDNMMTPVGADLY